MSRFVRAAWLVVVPSIVFGMAVFFFVSGLHLIGLGFFVVTVIVIAMGVHNYYEPEPLTNVPDGDPGFADALEGWSEN